MQVHKLVQIESTAMNIQSHNIRAICWHTSIEGLSPDGKGVLFLYAARHKGLCRREGSIKLDTRRIWMA